MSILEFIRDRARYYNCPVCGRSLDGCDVRMLKQFEDRFTVQVTCGLCLVQFVVVLAVQGESFDTEREVAHAAVRQDSSPPPEPIKSDEVLDVHLLLQDFTGPLTDLLPQPADRR